MRPDVEARLGAALETIGRLPVLEGTARAVRELAHDPHGSTDDLVAAIERDEGFAANLLRLANSAALARIVRAQTIRQAVTMVGRRSLARLAREAEVYRFLARAPGQGRVSRGQMHVHAVSVAGCAAAAVDLSERVWFGVATPEPGRGRALDLLADLGVQTCRFPLAWARVQPGGRGPLDPAGLDPYRRVAAGLLERGIEPVATLDRACRARWRPAVAGRRAPPRSASPSTPASRRGAGRLVDQWITVHEPWEVAFAGPASGSGGWTSALRASHHLLLAPGLALDAVRDGDLRAIARPVDFLGVDYDRPARVAAEPRHSPLGLELVPEDRPGRLHALLVRLRRDYGDIPIYLTETAAAHDDELARAVATASTCAAAARASPAIRRAPSDRRASMVCGVRNQLRPLFDRVVIKELDPDRVRRSGLVVPPGSHEPPPQHGIVLAVGPGIDWWEAQGLQMPVTPGDHVVFPASAGTWIEVDEERLLVCRVGELLGVLEQVQHCPYCDGRELAAGDTCPVCGRTGAAA